MYVKIRTDGALGMGRGTEGDAEITIGYGEAHMMSAALEKLAQTARSYKQTYKKTSVVSGKGNKIEFERTSDGDITISGDGNSYYCSEAEVRELAEMLKRLPVIEIAPSSDYVQKITPRDGFCLVVKNGGNQIPLKLAEAAVLKTAIISSMTSKYYLERLTMGKRSITLQRSSDLKWKLVGPNAEVKFTAYEVESLLAGIHNGILDLLMDLVKSIGSDKISDIRMKSQIQRVEKESAEIFHEHKKGKGLVRYFDKMTKKILGPGEDADVRSESFIELCNYVFSKMDPSYVEQLFELFTKTFLTTGA